MYGCVTLLGGTQTGDIVMLSSNNGKAKLQEIILCSVAYPWSRRPTINAKND